MHDKLGDRMKEQYEDRSRFHLPRRTYTILRLDGKAFHTFTRGLKKPFDEQLIAGLNWAAAKICKEIQGARFAYLQSDEISILLTDFDKHETECWFDGNLQKMVSVAASLMTGYFNQTSTCATLSNPRTAFFDCRAFQIPDPVEVENYFLWRQNDWKRNSVSMVAQSLYSHKQLHGKCIKEMLEMIAQKDVDYESFPEYLRFGTLITRPFDADFSPEEHPADDWIVCRTQLTENVPAISNQMYVPQVFK